MILTEEEIAAKCERIKKYAESIDCPAEYEVVDITEIGTGYSYELKKKK